MSYTDDPLADFTSYDRGQAKRLERLPECADCGEPIQDDHWYEFNDEFICLRCLEDLHRKDADLWG